VDVLPVRRRFLSEIQIILVDYIRVLGHDRGLHPLGAMGTAIVATAEPWQAVHYMLLYTTQYRKQLFFKLRYVD
jgi:hypothetical protein